MQIDNSQLADIYIDNFPIRNILVTGGCGFIGSNYLNVAVRNYPNITFHNIDRLDYCASLSNVTVRDHPNYRFYECDINDNNFINYILKTWNIDVVIHFAAQSHVDNSFDKSIQYSIDNILGTHRLLDCCKNYGKIKRFIHMSTDEVYGQVSMDHIGCTENSILNPTNPYSATKASAEMIVNSYSYSYSLPVIIIRCNNVYGPNQYHEKIIPKFIKLLKENKKLTIHGSGQALRSYIYVLDVVNAIDIIFLKGQVGNIYNIATNNEYSVLQIAAMLIFLIKEDTNFEKYIEYVTDRPFNDFRYSINCDKLKALGWFEQYPFIECIKTLI